MDLVAKVDNCGRDLAWWNRNVFGNVRKELDRLKKLLVQAKSVAVLNGNNHQVRHLKVNINVLLEKEATMWALRMTTDRVWAGFLHALTRPSGLNLRPRPGPIINRIFFPGAQTR